MKSFFITIFTILLLTAHAQITKDSLVVFYPFNGNVLDYSGNGVNGTVNGASLTQDRFLKSDSAFAFDGINDFITIKDTSIIKMSFPFSVSLWVVVDSYTTGHKTLISNCETANAYSGFSIKYWPTGEVYAFLGNGAGTAGWHQRRLETGVKLELGKWYHLAVSFNGLNDMEFYVNGNLVSGSYAGTGTTFANNSGHGIIGRNATPNGNYYHHGKIDDIRIYTDSLTSKDFKTLFYSRSCSVDTISIMDTIKVIDSVQVFDSIQVVDSVQILDSVQVIDTVFISQSITVADTMFINVALNTTPQQTSRVMVYPNPAKDKIYIDFGNNYQLMNGYSVNITNTLGQQVYYQQINTQLKVVSVSQMGSMGLFHLHVLNQFGQLITTKSIVLY